ncbi:hypothetical protein [Streptomyces gottesmaniae]|nr:hypothetical protein [Streptomyces sp. DSM 3412]
MDEAETQHLFDLARAASDGTRARRANPSRRGCRSERLTQQPSSTH